MNKVILIGKAAAGKDHMRKVLEGRGFTYGTSYTTRPPREGEIDGQDYYFISKETRTLRLKERGDLNDKIQRRIDADEIDFANFKDYDIVVNNPNF